VLFITGNNSYRSLARLNRDIPLSWQLSLITSPVELQATSEELLDEINKYFPIRKALTDKNVPVKEFLWNLAQKSTVRGKSPSPRMMSRGEERAAEHILAQKLYQLYLNDVRPETDDQSVTLIKVTKYFQTMLELTVDNKKELRSPISHRRRGRYDSWSTWI
jgi:hypothetical protein